MSTKIGQLKPVRVAAVCALFIALLAGLTYALFNPAEPGSSSRYTVPIGVLVGVGGVAYGMRLVWLLLRGEQALYVRNDLLCFIFNWELRIPVSQIRRMTLGQRRNPFEINFIEVELDGRKKEIPLNLLVGTPQQLLEHVEILVAAHQKPPVLRP
jgi:hypothetical protein